MRGAVRHAMALACLLAVLAPLPAAGHGGGLDALGCHHNRTAGGYHCHRGPLAGQAFRTKAEAEAALGDRQTGPRARSPAADPTTTPIAGRASVIDGDTIEIRGTRIRLHGIDAPESGQSCFDRDERPYRCGQQAALALADRIRQQTVSCERKDVDRFGRVVAECWLGSDNINAWLVLQGWAVAYRRFSTDYVTMEETARTEGRGIWAGRFTEPEEWRRMSR